MKTFILNVTIYLIWISTLSADITSALINYSKIECTFEEKDITDKKHKRRQHHSKDRKGGTPRPNVSIEQGWSVNWSGYVALTDGKKPKTGSVSRVSGSWIIPELLPTPDASYTAIWVGIDGYKSPTVEQLGTEHIWSNGVQQNIAWYEMYPNPAYLINGFPLSIGDMIEAEVSYKGSSQFELSIVNHTQNVFSIIPGSLTKSSTAKRNSAEWVVEAPYSSGILPLSDFQTVTFYNCKTVINSVKGNIASRKWQADHLIMATPTGVIKAVPSNLSSDYKNFSVAWVHE